MPIHGDAKKVKESMSKQYGEDKGERVFYATANKQGRKPETWEKQGFYTLEKNASFFRAQPRVKPVARPINAHLSGASLNRLPQTQENYAHIMRQLDGLQRGHTLADFPGWAVQRSLAERLGQQLQDLPTDMQLDRSHARRNVVKTVPYGIGAGLGGYGLYNLGQYIADQDR